MFKTKKDTEEDRVLLWALQMRAIICYSAMTLVRLFMMVKQDSYWFKE